MRGFIPPAVFTELQALGVLAIAADIRTHEHIEYTPAPDIVHESAGHAPIIANARYAEYLKRCGLVGFKAIATGGGRGRLRGHPQPQRGEGGPHRDAGGGCSTPRRAWRPPTRAAATSARAPAPRGSTGGRPSTG